MAHLICPIRFRLRNLLITAFLVTQLSACGHELALTNTLTAEVGGNQAAVAEAGERLTYTLTLTNTGEMPGDTNLTVTIPAGTTYAGNDEFSSVCNAGDSAGTTCTLSNFLVPAHGFFIFKFSVIVDDPVGADIIETIATAIDVDCVTSDCSESVPTTGIGSSSGLNTPFKTISQAEWNETSVRKVLHAFAYGGLMKDSQIAAWSSMPPEMAIQEMLTFTYTNELLSPGEDATGSHATSLESLQTFWGDANDPVNPMRWDKVGLYNQKDTITGTTPFFNVASLQRTWIQAINTRGINPFLHKVAFFLTNYQLSITASLANEGLVRSYYDQVIADLVARQPLTRVTATAAKSAATARRYNHALNIFNNSTMIFRGNDDFAREFFQLFFRYNGLSEDIDYHEGVNIANNAMLLTGMDVDLKINAYGSTFESDWWIAPIRFSDHNDPSGNLRNNLSNHHVDCLEIFHQQICGSTAAEKIDALAAIVALDPEVTEALPVYIIKHFADDDPTESKISKIKTAWNEANDDLLEFIRSYAISESFHSEDTIKYRSTFNRNLTLYNTVVLDNEEAFIGRNDSELPLGLMANQGGQVFLPVHDVFGGQTGTEASNNPTIFRLAYNTEVFSVIDKLKRTSLVYFTDATQSNEATWDKDWGAVAPTNGGGEYLVGEVADWLWQRIVGDGGKNFDVIARAQVLAILAHGQDFGYAVTLLNPVISTDPDATYTSSDLNNNPDIVTLMNALAAQTISLADSDVTGERRTANSRVSMAASFIAALPYTFALEGK